MSSNHETPENQGPTPHEPRVEREFVGQPTMPSAGGMPEKTANTPVSPAADEQLIQQTKLQIRTLVNEIQQLAQSDCTIDDFYDGFLSRVTSALASSGGAVWKVNESGRLELQFQINIATTELAGNENAQIAHDLLLRRLIEANEPALVQPNSGTGESEDASNPTSSLLVIERLLVDQKVVGLVEVFQRSGSGPTTQRGYLRFLVQMCEIASDFLKNKKIRTYQQQQELWEKLEQFIRASHHGLDPRQTAFTIANEGRRLVNCDRVSFAKKEGNKFRIEVVSGLDSIDRRADEVKKLGGLATSVVKGEKPLWYNGDTEDLPPQIERRLQEYVDRSHSKVVCVIPLWETHQDDLVEDPEPNAKKAKKDILGALIFERLGDSRIENSFRKRVEVVSAHASDALTNAQKHHGVFLMPLWQTISRTRIFSREAVPRWSIVLSVLLVLMGILTFLPWDFELSADGKLTPMTRYEIFAPHDGEVIRLIEPDAENQLFVTPGQTLIQLNSDELRGELIDLDGELAEARRMIGSAEDKLRTPELSIVESLRLEQEITTNYVRVQGLNRERELIRQKFDKLAVVSPGAGRIVDWQLKDKLDGRQISRGENLMTVVDESGEWVIELEMLEKKFGHLSKATTVFEEDLKVTFVLASLPNEKFSGSLISYDQKADVRGENGNVILLRIKFDKNDIPADLLLYGTQVTARIYCGKRPLGYVLFREVYETLQRNVFFWF
ncbi:MAG: HlyD family secretion protein [Pirellulaceae bacterium]|nr:HlyD family secretion protein [Pirellulaceae bacterium]